MFDDYGVCRRHGAVQCRICVAELPHSAPRKVLPEAPSDAALVQAVDRLTAAVLAVAEALTRK